VFPKPDFVYSADCTILASRGVSSHDGFAEAGDTVQVLSVSIYRVCCGPFFSTRPAGRDLY